MNPRKQQIALQMSKLKISEAPKFSTDVSSNVSVIIKNNHQIHNNLQMLFARIVAVTTLLKQIAYYYVLVIVLLMHENYGIILVVVETVCLCLQVGSGYKVYGMDYIIIGQGLLRSVKFQRLERSKRMCNTCFQERIMRYGCPSCQLCTHCSISYRYHSTLLDQCLKDQNILFLQLYLIIAILSQLFNLSGLGLMQFYLLLDTQVGPHQLITGALVLILFIDVFLLMFHCYLYVIQLQDRSKHNQKKSKESRTIQEDVKEQDIESLDERHRQPLKQVELVVEILRPQDSDILTPARSNKSFRVIDYLDKRIKSKQGDSPCMALGLGIDVQQHNKDNAESDEDMSVSVGNKIQGLGTQPKRFKQY